MKIPYLNDAFFSRLESLVLLLKKDLSGYFGGKHLVRTYGQTVEFADYREYQLGDDIRRIDWNLYSRFEKYFLKLFTDERQMHIRVFLDCSASMGNDAPQKSAYAIAMAAAIGYLAVHNMDKVSFYLMRGDRAENPFGTIVGKRAFFQAMGTLEQTHFDGETDIAACVLGSGEIASGSGLSVILSDFFTESDWKKAADYLLFRRQQVILMQPLLPEEVDPNYDGRYHLLDSEAGDISDRKNMRLHITHGMQEAYADALRDFREEIRSYCVTREIAYLCLTTDQPIERALFGELARGGIVS